MSYKEEKILSLAAADISDKSARERHDLFSNVLKSGIHGIGFSPYGEGQKPGDEITEEQIRHRMAIIKPYVKWVRSFSCLDGNEKIPKVAHEMGIKTLVGAWLGEDEEKNALEIEGLIKLAKAPQFAMFTVSKTAPLSPTGRSLPAASNSLTPVPV